MDASAVLAGFVEACAGLHHPATRVQAEQALLEFRRTAGIEACVAVLQQSSDEGVRFQAVLALREILLGRWAVLGKAAQQGALQFLLQLALTQLAGDPRPLLRTQVTATIAAIVKRSWPDASQTERDAALQDIYAQATQLGSLEARRAGLELLRAVVEEFSPTTASAMGLTWEVHERCRESLEQGYLHGLLLHALASAREAAPAAVSGADGGVCLAALHLLSAIFSWSFSRAGGSGIWRVLESGRPVADVTQLRPPATWRDALLAPDAWGWLAQLSQATCQPQAPQGGLPTAVQTVVVQLCGLSGDVFGPAEAPGGRAALGLSAAASPRQTHLLCMLRMLLPWVTPAATAIERARWSASSGEGSSDSLLLAACRGLLAAAGVHRASGFEAASAALGLPPGPAAIVPTGAGGPAAASAASAGAGIFALLSDLTLAVVAAAESVGGRDDWDGEAAELLLDAWLELVADPCRGPLGAPEAALAAAAAVFSGIVDAGLRQAAAEALEDEEEAEGGEMAQLEEWRARVAALGRASASLSMPLLADKLQGCLAQLQQCMQSGADPSVPLEQLCWLIAMCGHVLADGGEGETPLIPLPVVQACEAAAAAGRPDPAERLSTVLLSLGGHCLANAGQAGISPRLMEVTAASLARWADTYLMADSSSSGGNSGAGGAALAASFGPGSAGGSQAAQMLVSLVMAALTRYPGERALHEVVCAKLLAALVRRSAVSQPLLDTPAWHALCDAVGRGDAGLLQLAEKVQRRLLQSLLMAAEGFPGDAGNWAGQLLESTAAQLRQLGASEAAARAALQRADGLHLIVSLLERFRGAVRGTLPPTQPAVFHQFTSVAPPLATLLAACRTQPMAVTLVLKLAGEVIEQHAAYLAPSDASALCGWALQLLQTYSAHNLGQVSVAASKTLAAEALSDRYLDLRALIKLLTKLTQADWANSHPHSSGGGAGGGGGGGSGGQQDGEAAVDVAELVFAGLDILVPLLSLELLKFPKLCRAYFALLAHMLEVYPERMAVLPGRVFSTLVSTLQYGVGTATGDEEVTQAVFEAAAALARFHVQSLAAGGAGLGNNNAAGPDGVTPLGSLLQASLQRLIHGDSGLEAVDHAAEAVLPLALSDPPVLQRSGEALLTSCADGAAKASAQATFSSLIAQVGAAASLDRPSRRAFASALSKFVVDMRGAVYVR